MGKGQPDRVLSDGGKVDAKRGRGQALFPAHFSGCLDGDGRAFEG